jgi:magnesium-transporting ATPase (P-type)
LSAPAAQHHDALSAGVAVGLTSAEAHERLASCGANETADVSQHPVRLALEQLWAPIPWMLEAAIVVSAPLREYPEAAVVALLLVFNAALSLFQQSRAQTTLDALKMRLALNAQVKRDGPWITAPAANLVADDIVKLTLGAVVPADVRVLTGSVLVDALATEGFRIIAVPAGPTGDLTLQVLIGLSDPPHDAAGLVAQLATLGVRMVMITGDAPATAGFVAHAVGIGGAMSTTSSLPPNVNAKTFAIFAGVLPEDKFASSRPSRWLVASSVANSSIIAVLAIKGILVTSISLSTVAELFVGAVVFAFVLDSVKFATFAKCPVA